MVAEGENPGAGSPAGIRSLARMRESRSSELRRVRATVAAADDSVNASEWSGTARRAFSAAVARTGPDLELLVNGLDAQVSALMSYAGRLEILQQEQERLEARRRGAHAALGTLRAELAFGGALSATNPSATLDAGRTRARTEDRISEQRSLLAAVDGEWDRLVATRRQLDASTAAILSGPAVLGAALAAAWPHVSEASGPPSPTAVLSLLGSLSPTDIHILLRQRPELGHILGRAEPEEVAQWWRTLSGPGGEHSDAQLALLAAVPLVLGSLDGLPALARVRANALNAGARIDTVTKLIANYAPFPTTVRRLERELDFLQRAVGDNPTVQLYLYEPDTSRIVEMIGTPSASTTHVITYVPGTFTDLASFYGSGVQRVAHYVADSRDGDTVAFVYKDGVFPAAEDNSEAVNMQRFLEANDPARALEAGKQLASFQNALRCDPSIESRKTAAIGHSWGLAAVTSSEVAGARYDTVVSLSGAGMPPSWQPSAGTAYADFSYYDVLQEAQIVGGKAVWNGMTPRSHPAFDSPPYFFTPTEALRRLPNGTPYAVDQGVLLDAHNLVATDCPENAKLLEAVSERIFR